MTSRPSGKRRTGRPRPWPAVPKRSMPAKPKWLVEHIGVDRPLYENERALLTLIKHASPEIHPALRPLLDKVA